MSREIVFFLQCPVDISIATFKDRYLNSCVRLDRSTWIWAIVDDTAMLATAVPFGWGMGRKYVNFFGKVLPEVGSNRSIAQMQDLKKLNWRQIEDEFWKQTCLCILSFVNVHFTGKRHWDCLELVPILSWFLFCRHQTYLLDLFMRDPFRCVARRIHMRDMTRSVCQHRKREREMYVNGERERYIHVHVCIYTHMCIYIYVYIYMYIYMYTYIYHPADSWHTHGCIHTHGQHVPMPCLSAYIHTYIQTNMYINA